jgi:hypothetical protein
MCGDYGDEKAIRPIVDFDASISISNQNAKFIRWINDDIDDILGLKTTADRANGLTILDTDDFQSAICGDKKTSARGDQRLYGRKRTFHLPKRQPWTCICHRID